MKLDFSNDELRVLKGMTKSGDWPISGKQLKPLIARLEKSEWERDLAVKVCWNLWLLARNDKAFPLTGSLANDLQAWLDWKDGIKVAGK